MERRLHVGLGDDAFHNLGDGWDPNDLLHPAQAFEHPSHVVNDPDLTLNEKRAILASWASDACAPQAAPHLRRAPGGKQPVLFDEVMEALRTLDKQASEQGKDSARYRRLLRRSRFERRSRSPSGEDHSLIQAKNRELAADEAEYRARSERLAVSTSVKTQPAWHP